MKLPDEPVNPIQASAPLVGVRAPMKKRILVVDDERPNVELLSRLLTNGGYDVSNAHDGEDAIIQIGKNPPDLVFLDVRMPVMNGIEACRRLRSDFRTRSLPIILLTACDSQEDRLRGLRAGGDDYITKPFDWPEVQARLENTLERRRWDLASNPLTHLPGSPAIEEETWKRLRTGLPFAFAYLDLDHFKAYNDIYGYDAGDKIIKRVADGLMVRVGEEADSFAGHIGGDDFVFLSTVDGMKRGTAALLAWFDDERKNFYTADHLARGGIQTKNRMGEVKDFPLLSLSVAIVSTQTRRILHYLRLVETASELKRYIKSQPHHGKSLAMWDRRTG